MEENQDYETIDLLELLGVLRQHILALLLTTVLAALAGFLVSSFVLTPQYQASALMIVNTRQDTSANVTSDQLNSASRLVSTYSIIVKSDTVLNQVIANLGLNMTYETLASKVEVSAVDETQVMEITVTDPNPDGARQVCEQITQVAPDAILTAVEAGSVKVIGRQRGPGPGLPQHSPQHRHCRRAGAGGLRGHPVPAGAAGQQDQHRGRCDQASGPDGDRRDPQL